MNNIEPISQTKLFGLDKFIIELIQLDKSNKLPSKILLSGQKGLGKSTLAYHFINYALTKNEDFNYDINNFEININNSTFKTILNGSNPNLITIDMNIDNKSIDINQIRELIIKLNKSSLNNKPRFVLIDNIEILHLNSVNALLKVLEEPSSNIYFILINNNKKILPTLLSRCINFKISLSNEENLKIAARLLNENVNKIINEDLINYYLTPGNLYKLLQFGIDNEYDLKNIKLKELLKLIIKNNHYKKDSLFKYQIYDFIEFYFTKIHLSMPNKVYEKYTYFLKRISDTKRFNLDEESLFIEFEEKILNG